jgi:uncharacterized protein YutE (UPF0331/DUF86 family)
MTIEKLELYYKSEIENIDKVLKTLLENKEAINSNDPIRLSGVGVYLFNFYNGIENILIRVFKYKGIKTKQGPFWHKELLKEALTKNIISEKLYDLLTDYLGFRHYFVHGYAFTLEIDRLQKLIKNISSVYQEFKKNIESSLNINS